MTNSACAILESKLKERHNLKLFREQLTADSAQQPERYINGQHFITFCSNDYLGLANHPDVINSFKKAADIYGVGSGASHIILGHSRAHNKLEEALQEFTGREKVLLFSTGYMANLGVITALTNNKSLILQDKLNHASLIDAGKLSDARFLRYQHASPSSLERMLEREKISNTYTNGIKIIATDGLFSMDGDNAPLPDLASIAKKHDALLMVDDAHGLGCLGSNGKGSCDLFGLNQNDVPLLTGTLGKSFGVSGAFVAAEKTIIEYLLQFSRPYIYTTAPPPALAEAAITSLCIAKNESWRRLHLMHLITYFKKECSKRSIPITSSNSPIQPLLIGSSIRSLAVSKSLAEQRIMVTAIRPPTVPKNTARLRITLSASHSTDQIDQLIDALDLALRKFPQEKI